MELLVSYRAENKHFIDKKNINQVSLELRDYSSTTTLKWLFISTRWEKRFVKEQQQHA